MTRQRVSSRWRPAARAWISSAGNAAKKSCSTRCWSVYAATSRVAPSSVRRTVTSRRSSDSRLRSTRPSRSSVFSTLETAARESPESREMSRGSSSPATQTQNMTRNPAIDQPAWRWTSDSRRWVRRVAARMRSKLARSASRSVPGDATATAAIAASSNSAAPRRRGVAGRAGSCGASVGESATLVIVGRGVPGRCRLAARSGWGRILTADVGSPPV